MSKLTPLSRGLVTLIILVATVLAAGWLLDRIGSSDRASGVDAATAPVAFESGAVARQLGPARAAPRRAVVGVRA